MLSDQEHLTTKLITMAAWWETSLKQLDTMENHELPQRLNWQP